MKQDSTSDSQQQQGRNPPQAEGEPRRRRNRRYSTPLILLGALAAASFLIWKLFFATRAPENIITLSGRIEGDDSAIAPKVAGRILEVRYREGDEVQAGDPIAILDVAQIRAREDQARAALSTAEARAQAARDQIAVLQQQLRQNELETEQSKTDAEGRVRQAEAELTAAEADLAEQEAAYTIAKFDKEAYTRLAETGAVSERQGKQASATAAQQAAAVAAATRRVEAARGALLTAKANLKNPNIRRAGVAAVQNQITQQRAEASAAEAEAEQARAQLREAQADRDDLIIRAPFSGTVTTRAAEPGEVVTAGTALVTLVDLSKVYLRGFVPEGEIGLIKVGQAARVYLDSNPNQPIPAYVSRIDPQATFTPENTYFRDDRVKQVVGVKLQLQGAIGLAKPGMPADGEILFKGDVWPSEKRTR